MTTNTYSRRRDGETVETSNYVVVQASNGHIQVYSKDSRCMMMHINRTEMCSKEQLQTFAENLQALENNSFDDIIVALQALE